MEAAPQPPSLDLPKTIPNLTANRTGNQVHLAWTTPSENTDHLKLKGMVQLRLCRTQQDGYTLRNHRDHFRRARQAGAHTRTSCRPR